MAKVINLSSRSNVDFARVMREVDLHEQIFPKLRTLEPESFCNIITGMVHFWCKDYQLDELWLMDVMKTSLADRQYSKRS